MIWETGQGLWFPGAGSLQVGTKRDKSTEQEAWHSGQGEHGLFSQADRCLNLFSITSYMTIGRLLRIE